MKNNYYSVYSKGRNYKNLIDLRSRPIEERREIARKGGLARQEQRRETFRLRKALNNYMLFEDFISQYTKKNRRNRLNFRSLNSFSASYGIALQEDIAEARTNLLKEMEKEELKRIERKKKQRKKINHRYYMKHRKKKSK